MKSKTCLLIFSLLACFVAATPALAQNDGRIHLPPAVQQGPDTGTIPVKSADQVDRERSAKMQELRQEAIRRDTEKLFQLSVELKDYVDKSSNNVLSLDMIKKAETIEKLARSVKDKMKASR